MGELTHTPSAVDPLCLNLPAQWLCNVSSVSRSARSKGNKVLDELISKVSDEDEKTFELGKQIAKRAVIANELRRHPFR